MRILHIREASDLQKVAERLGGTTSAATLARLKTLNPQVDAGRIGAGTVLLVPDESDPQAADRDVHATGTGLLEVLARDIEAGFDGLAERVREAAAGRAAEHAAVTAALKTAAVKRQLDADPALKEQLDEALRAAAASQKSDKDAVDRIEAQRKAAQQDLAALAGLRT